MAHLDGLDKELTVTVTFVNQLDQSIIGRSELSLDKLPESFAVHTVLHLGDEDWQVLSADPCEKSEFVKTRELTLIMKRIESIDPIDILYSLPTIASELPAFAESTFSVNFTHEMREDDWRQCEFFEVHQKEQILKEIAKIEDLKAESHPEGSSSIGYKRIHLRDLTHLSALSMSLVSFLHQLKVSDVGAIQFENNPGYVAQGFAVETVDNMFYGVLDVKEKGCLELDNLVIRILGVQPKVDHSQELVQLLQVFDLLYVDWCEGETIDRLN